MATNEIQNGCESSIEAVLPSNHKRRCLLTAKHPELGAGFGTKNLGRQTKTHSAKRDAKRDTFKTRYSPIGIRICDLLPLGELAVAYDQDLPRTVSIDGQLHQADGELSRCIGRSFSSRCFARSCLRKS